MFDFYNFADYIIYKIQSMNNECINKNFKLNFVSDEFDYQSFSVLSKDLAYETIQKYIRKELQSGILESIFYNKLGLSKLESVLIELTEPDIEIDNINKAYKNDDENHVEDIIRDINFLIKVYKRVHDFLVINKLFTTVQLKEITDYYNSVIKKLNNSIVKIKKLNDSQSADDTFEEVIVTEIEEDIEMDVDNGETEDTAISEEIYDEDDDDEYEKITLSSAKEGKSDFIEDMRPELRLLLSYVPRYKLVNGNWIPENMTIKINDNSSEVTMYYDWKEVINYLAGNIKNKIHINNDFNEKFLGSLVQLLKSEGSNNYTNSIIIGLLGYAYKNNRFEYIHNSIFLEKLGLKAVLTDGNLTIEKSSSSPLLPSIVSSLSKHTEYFYTILETGGVFRQNMQNINSAINSLTTPMLTSKLFTKDTNTLIYSYNRKSVKSLIKLIEDKISEKFEKADEKEKKGKKFTLDVSDILKLVFKELSVVAILDIDPVMSEIADNLNITVPVKKESLDFKEMLDANTNYSSLLFDVYKSLKAIEEDFEDNDTINFDEGNNKYNFLLSSNFKKVISKITAFLIKGVSLSFNSSTGKAFYSLVNSNRFNVFQELIGLNIRNWSDSDIPEFKTKIEELLRVYPDNAFLKELSKIIKTKGNSKLFTMNNLEFGIILSVIYDKIGKDFDNSEDVLRIISYLKAWQQELEIDDKSKPIVYYPVFTTANSPIKRIMRSFKYFVLNNTEDNSLNIIYNSDSENAIDSSDVFIDSGDSGPYKELSDILEGPYFELKQIAIAIKRNLDAESLGLTEKEIKKNMLKTKFNTYLFLNNEIGVQNILNRLKELIANNTSEQKIEEYIDSEKDYMQSLYLNYLVSTSNEILQDVIKKIALTKGFESIFTKKYQMSLFNKGILPNIIINDEFLDAKPSSIIFPDDFTDYDKNSINLLRTILLNKNFAFKKTKGTSSPISFKTIIDSIKNLAKALSSGQSTSSIMVPSSIRGRYITLSEGATMNDLWSAIFVLNELISKAIDKEIKETESKIEQDPNDIKLKDKLKQLISLSKISYGVNNTDIEDIKFGFYNNETFAKRLTAHLVFEQHVNSYINSVALNEILGGDSSNFLITNSNSEIIALDSIYNYLKRNTSYRSLMFPHDTILSKVIVRKNDSDSFTSEEKPIIYNGYIDDIVEASNEIYKHILITEDINYYKKFKSKLFKINKTDFSGKDNIILRSILKKLDSEDVTKEDIMKLWGKLSSDFFEKRNSEFFVAYENKNSAYTKLFEEVSDKSYFKIKKTDAADTASFLFYIKRAKAYGQISPKFADVLLYGKKGIDINDVFHQLNTFLTDYENNDKDIKSLISGVDGIELRIQLARKLYEDYKTIDGDIKLIVNDIIERLLDYSSIISESNMKKLLIELSEENKDIDILKELDVVTMKDVVVTNIKNEKLNIMELIFDKNATRVLLPTSLDKNERLNKLRQLMELRGIDRVSPPSSIKTYVASIQFPSKENSFWTHSENSDIFGVMHWSFNNMSILELNSNDVGEQTPQSIASTSLFSSQSKSLIFTDQKALTYEYEVLNGNTTRRLVLDESFSVKPLTGKEHFLSLQKIANKVYSYERKKLLKKLSNEDGKIDSRKFLDYLKLNLSHAKSVTDNDLAGLMTSEDLILFKHSDEYANIQEVIKDLEDNTELKSELNSILTENELSANDFYQFVLPVMFMPNSFKIQSIMNSLVKTRITDTGLKGLLTPDTRIKSEQINIEDYKSKIVLTNPDNWNGSTALKDIRFEDGIVKPTQVIVSWNFKGTVHKYLKLLDDGSIVEITKEEYNKNTDERTAKKENLKTSTETDADKNILREYFESKGIKNKNITYGKSGDIVYVKYVDNNRGILDIDDFLLKPGDEGYQQGKKILDLKKLPVQILRGFGVRIPTQEKSSMAYFEIVGFLQSPEKGTMIAPSDFIVRMGSDFDIDTLYSLLYNYKYDFKNNRFVLNRYIPEELNESLYIKYYKEHINNITKKGHILYNIYGHKSFKKDGKKDNLEDEIKSIFDSIKSRKTPITDVLKAFDEINNLISSITEHYDTAPENSELKKDSVIIGNILSMLPSDMKANFKRTLKLNLKLEAIYNSVDSMDGNKKSKARLKNIIDDTVNTLDVSELKEYIKTNSNSKTQLAYENILKSIDIYISYKKMLGNDYIEFSLSKNYKSANYLSFKESLNKKLLKLRYYNYVKNSVTKDKDNVSGDKKYLFKLEKASSKRIDGIQSILEDYYNDSKLDLSFYDEDSILLGDDKKYEQHINDSKYDILFQRSLLIDGKYTLNAKIKKLKEKVDKNDNDNKELKELEENLKTINKILDDLKENYDIKTYIGNNNSKSKISEVTEEINGIIEEMRKEIDNFGENNFKKLSKLKQYRNKIYEIIKNAELKKISQEDIDSIKKLTFIESNTLRRILNSIEQYNSHVSVINKGVIEVIDDFINIFEFKNNLSKSVGLKFKIANIISKTKSVMSYLEFKSLDINDQNSIDSLLNKMKDHYITVMVQPENLHSITLSLDYGDVYKDQDQELSSETVSSFISEFKRNNYSFETLDAFIQENSLASIFDVFNDKNITPDINNWYYNQLMYNRMRSTGILIGAAALNQSFQALLRISGKNIGYDPSNSLIVDDKIVFANPNNSKQLVSNSFDDDYVVNIDGKKVSKYREGSLYVSLGVDDPKIQTTSRINLTVLSLNAINGFIASGFDHRHVLFTFNQPIIKELDETYGQLITMGNGKKVSLNTAFSNLLVNYAIAYNNLVSPDEALFSSDSEDIIHDILINLQNMRNNSPISLVDMMKALINNYEDDIDNKNYYYTQLQSLYNYIVAYSIGELFSGIYSRTNTDSKGTPPTYMGIIYKLDYIEEMYENHPLTNIDKILGEPIYLRNNPKLDLVHVKDSKLIFSRISDILYYIQMDNEDLKTDFNALSIDVITYNDITIGFDKDNPKESFKILIDNIVNSIKGDYLSSDVYTVYEKLYIMKHILLEKFNNDHKTVQFLQMLIENILEKNSVNNDLVISTQVSTLKDISLDDKQYLAYIYDKLSSTNYDIIRLKNVIIIPDNYKGFAIRDGLMFPRRIYSNYFKYDSPLYEGLMKEFEELAGGKIFKSDQNSKFIEKHLLSWLISSKYEADIDRSKFKLDLVGKLLKFNTLVKDKIDEFEKLIKADPSNEALKIEYTKWTNYRTFLLSIQPEPNYNLLIYNSSFNQINNQVYKIIAEMFTDNEYIDEESEYTIMNFGEDILKYWMIINGGQHSLRSISTVFPNIILIQTELAKKLRSINWESSKDLSLNSFAIQLMQSNPKFMIHRRNIIRISRLDNKYKTYSYKDGYRVNIYAFKVKSNTEIDVTPIKGMTAKGLNKIYISFNYLYNNFIRKYNAVANDNISKQMFANLMISLLKDATVKEQLMSIFDIEESVITDMISILEDKELLVNPDDFYFQIDNLGISKDISGHKVIEMQNNSLIPIGFSESIENKSLFGHLLKIMNNMMLQSVSENKPLSIDSSAFETIVVNDNNFSNLNFIKELPLGKYYKYDDINFNSVASIIDYIILNSPKKKSDLIEYIINYITSFNPNDIKINNKDRNSIIALLLYSKNSDDLVTEIANRIIGKISVTQNKDKIETAIAKLDVNHVIEKLKEYLTELKENIYTPQSTQSLLMNQYKSLFESLVTNEDFSNDIDKIFELYKTKSNKVRISIPSISKRFGTTADSEPDLPIYGNLLKAYLNFKLTKENVIRVEESVIKELERKGQVVITLPESEMLNKNYNTTLSLVSTNTKISSAKFLTQQDISDSFIYVTFNSELVGDNIFRIELSNEEKIIYDNYVRLKNNLSKSQEESNEQLNYYNKLQKIISSKLGIKSSKDDDTFKSENEILTQLNLVDKNSLEDFKNLNNDKKIEFLSNKLITLLRVSNPSNAILDKINFYRKSIEYYNDSHIVSQEVKLLNNMSEYVGHSGGALKNEKDSNDKPINSRERRISSDLVWEDIGSENYGMQFKSYTFRGHSNGSKKEFKVYTDNSEYAHILVEAEQEYEKAASALGRNTTSNDYVKKLMLRNWFQVKFSDKVFAIGVIKNNKVEGGTGYAVQMAINNNKPVVVFDQSDNKWKEWNGSMFVTVDTPILTPNFAGIGTREITEAGVQAIKDVYEKTKNAIDNKIPEQNFSYEEAVKEADSKEPIEQNFFNGYRPNSNKSKVHIIIPEIVEKYGEKVSTFTLVKEGVRTRTTRTKSWMKENKPKVGDYFWQIDKKNPNDKVLTKITAVYGNDDPRFKDNWYKEGWIDDNFDFVKDYEAAIEFEVVKEPVPEENVKSVEIVSSYTKSTPNDKTKGFFFTENLQAYLANRNRGDEINFGLPSNEVKLDVTVSNNQAGIRQNNGKRNLNAFAIISKKFQQDNKGDFVKKEGQFEDTDEDFELFKKYNTEALKEASDSNLPLVILKSGIATGKSALPLRFAEWLNEKLKDEFGIMGTIRENTQKGYNGYGIYDIELVSKENITSEPSIQPVSSNDVNSEDDGKTHINIYSNGKTELGKLLSNFAHTEFTFNGYKFASVESWWYWTKMNNINSSELFPLFTDEQINNIRSKVGFDAKKYFRDIVGDNDNYKYNPTKDELKAVYLQKLEEHSKIKKMLLSNNLPFAHYYMMKDEKGRDFKKDANNYLWTADLWREIKLELTAKKDEPVSKPELVKFIEESDKQVVFDSGIDVSLFKDVSSKSSSKPVLVYIHDINIKNDKAQVTVSKKVKLANVNIDHIIKNIMNDPAIKALSERSSDLSVNFLEYKDLNVSDAQLVIQAIVKRMKQILSKDELYIKVNDISYRLFDYFPNSSDMKDDLFNITYKFDNRKLIDSKSSFLLYLKEALYNDESIKRIIYNKTIIGNNDGDKVKILTEKAETELRLLLSPSILEHLKKDDTFRDVYFSIGTKQIKFVTIKDKYSDITVDKLFFSSKIKGAKKINNFKDLDKLGENDAINILAHFVHNLVIDEHNFKYIKLIIDKALTGKLKIEATTKNRLIEKYLQYVANINVTITDEVRNSYVLKVIPYNQNNLSSKYAVKSNIDNLIDKVKSLPSSQDKLKFIRTVSVNLSSTEKTEFFEKLKEQNIISVNINDIEDIDACG